MSLTSASLWLLFNSNARKLTPRCHHATLTEMSGFALWKLRGRGKNVFKRKIKIIVSYILSFGFTRRVIPVLKCPSLHGRSFQGSGVLPIRPRHCSLLMVLLPFLSHCQISMSHSRDFPSSEKTPGLVCCTGLLSVKVVLVRVGSRDMCCGRRSSECFQYCGEPWAVKGGEMRG